MNLEKEIQEIKERNIRVENDKAWETSATRKVAVLTLTYISMVILFLTLNNDSPFVNATIPTLGYFLSTQTIPFIKKRWLKRNNPK